MKESTLTTENVTVQYVSLCLKRENYLRKTGLEPGTSKTQTTAVNCSAPATLCKAPLNLNIAFAQFTGGHIPDS